MLTVTSIATAIQRALIIFLDLLSHIMFKLI